MQKIPEFVKKVRYSFEICAAKVLKIQAETGQTISFTFNVVQQLLWKIVLSCLLAGKPVRILFLKSRQQGGSTFFEGLAYWVCAFRRNRNGLIVAHTKTDAEKLFNKIKIFYKYSPEGLRPQIKISNREEIYFASPDDKGQGESLDSRIIIQTAENPNLGVSQTIHYAHLSELDLWNELGYDPKPRLVALKQAMPDLPGTFLCIESTGRGNGYFKQLWDADNDYIKIFVSWAASKKYRKDLKPDEYFVLQENEDDLDNLWGDEATEYEDVKKELIKWYKYKDGSHELNHEIMRCLNWRRWAIVNKCESDLGLFRREYPTKPEHAFASWGVSIFNLRMLNKMQKFVEKPHYFKFDEKYIHILSESKANVDIYAKRAFIKSSQKQHLQIFRFPQKGHRYVIAADSGEGNIDSDPSAFTVYGFGQNEIYEAACFNEVIKPYDYAFILYCIATIYNKALIAVEVNEPAGFSTNEILNQRLKYKNLYKRIQFGEVEIESTDKTGWKTTAYTKQLIIDTFKNAIKDGEIKLNSVNGFEQLKEFRKLADGSTGVKKPGHDDEAMSKLIGFYIAKSSPKHYIPENDVNYADTLKYWDSQLKDDYHDVWFGSGR